MEVVITADADAAAEIVALVVRRVLESRPAPVIGLATGSSPLGSWERSRKAIPRLMARGTLPG